MKLHPAVEPLLAEIDAFLARTGMSATAFGKAACNDGHFLKDLRKKGRLPSLNTIDSVRAFMAAHAGQEAESA